MGVDVGDGKGNRRPIDSLTLKIWQICVRLIYYVAKLPKHCFPNNDKMKSKIKADCCVLVGYTFITLVYV